MAVRNRIANSQWLKVRLWNGLEESRPLAGVPHEFPAVPQTTADRLEEMWGWEDGKELILQVLVMCLTAVFLGSFIPPHLLLQIRT